MCGCCFCFPILRSRKMNVFEKNINADVFFCSSLSAIQCVRPNNQNAFLSKSSGGGTSLRWCPKTGWVPSPAFDGCMGWSQKKKLIVNACAMQWWCFGHTTLLNGSLNEFRWWFLEIVRPTQSCKQLDPECRHIEMMRQLGRLVVPREHVMVVMPAFAHRNNRHTQILDRIDFSASFSFSFSFANLSHIRRTNIDLSNLNIG